MECRINTGLVLLLLLFSDKTVAGASHDENITTPLPEEVDFDSAGSEHSELEPQDKNETCETSDYFLLNPKTKSPTDNGNSNETIEDDFHLRTCNTTSSNVSNKSKDLHQNISLEKFFTGYCSTEKCRNEEAEGCYCDRKCYYFRDCCYLYIEKDFNDYRRFQSNESSISDMIEKRQKEHTSIILVVYENLMECASSTNNSHGYWMVSRCPQGTKATQDVIEKCEKTAFYNYNNMPVDLVNDGYYYVSFKNIFCALCNDIKVEQLNYWSVEVYCDVLSNSTVRPGMSTDEIAEVCVIKFESKYMTSLRQCDRLVYTLAVPDIPNNASTHELDMYYLCESYIMPVSPFNASNISPKDVYRNPHCAALLSDDGIDSVNDKFCVFGLGSSFHTYLDSSKDNEGSVTGLSRLLNLKVIFDFDPNTGGVAVKVICPQDKVCKSYQVYDCITSKCRNLYCPTASVPVHGNCIPLPNTHGHPDQFSLPKDKEANTTDERYIVIEVYGNEEFMSWFENVTDILQSFVNGWISVLYPHSNGFVFRRIGSKTYQVETSLGFLEVYKIVEIIYETIIEEYEENTENKDEDKTASTAYAMMNPDIRIVSRNFMAVESLFCQEELVIDNDTGITEDYGEFLYNTHNLSVSTNKSRWSLECTSGGLLVSLVATCAPLLNFTELNCSLVAYNISEVLFQNETLVIADHTFSMAEYFILDESVFVCSDLVKNKMEYINIFQYMEHYTALTFVTSVISIFSLILVLFYHMIDKKLLNIHGLNLTAMSSSVLLIHLMLVFQLFIQDHTVCMIYAMVLHFLLLNMFTWMNVIGVEMARIFYRGSVVSTQKPCTKFSKYLTVSIAIPGMILAVAVLLEFTSDAIVRPHYGHNDICWLANGDSVIVFVIVPVGTSLLVSVISFSITVRCIYVQSMQTKLVRSTGGTSYVLVFLKLTCILGLTWIFALIGAFVQVEWLWVGHIILNGLQGLSLLICSVANKRAIKMLKSSAKHFSSETGINRTEQSKEVQLKMYTHM